MMRYLTSLVLGSLAPLAFVSAQEKVTVPAGSPLNITVTAGAVPPPPVSITLYERHGHVTPIKDKLTHTGRGLIEVTSPTPDTILISMSGAVVANSEMKFDLQQSFEISFDDPKIKKAKLAIEGRVIGLLRGERKGCAGYTEACASVLASPAELMTVCVPPHQASGCGNLAINDHDGPKFVPVVPGKYNLQQSFTISAHSDCPLFKRPSAEFAPDPALDPLWITYFDPFHGVKKESFGFQVIVKVVPDTGDGNADKKPAELVPAPAEKK